MPPNVQPEVFHSPRVGKCSDACFQRVGSSAYFCQHRERSEMLAVRKILPISSGTELIGPSSAD